MEWRDVGLIIGTRRFGETSLIVEAMTRNHGRHLGLVRGGRSKRLHPLLQPGNSASLTWRARLEEHLGFYAVETTTMRVADLLASPDMLCGFNHLGALLHVLAEREPSEPLYATAELMLGAFGTLNSAAVLMVKFEAALLAQSGFGFDLSECAATGRRTDLRYVSPKSGRAVCGEAGEPYRNRLLRLPKFLLDGHEDMVSRDDLLDGFELTGFFLARDIYTPRGSALPDARFAFVERVRRHVSL